MQQLRQITLLLALITAGIFFLTGCATDQETDLPWNSQQPWEGSPTIPGLPTYR